MISHQRRGRGLGARLVVAVALPALVLLSCTTASDEATPPSPPPPAEEDEEPADPVGAEVVVVLPPRTTLAPEAATWIAGDLTALEDEYADEVRVIRTRYPDEAIFVRDIAALAAREGVDLLCVAGSVGRQLASELSELHPVGRFCSLTPDEPPEEPEDRVDVVGVRVVELGHLLGAAARELAGQDGVALALGATELQRGRFREGLGAALGPTPIVELDDELPPDEAVAAAVAEGAGVVVIGTGPEAVVHTEAALDAGAHVITHAALVGESDEVALTWNLRWDLVLKPAVDRLLGRPGVGRHELGLTDDVFELVPGAAAPAGLEAALAVVEDELRAGERDPLKVIEPEEPEVVDDEEVDGPEGEVPDDGPEGQTPADGPEGEAGDEGSGESSDEQPEGGQPPDD